MHSDPLLVRAAIRRFIHSLQGPARKLARAYQSVRIVIVTLCQPQPEHILALHSADSQCFLPIMSRLQPVHVSIAI